MEDIKRMTFKVISMGCKVNYYEVESISAILVNAGLIRKLSNDDITDITIVNTCTVTEEASRKSKQMIRRYINQNPDGISICMGCLVQIDETIKNIKGVNILLGSSNKELILKSINEYLLTKNQVNWIEKDIFHMPYDNLTVERFEAHTRAFLKIEDGCTNFCSYCIIPYARGRVRSKPLDLVIKEAKALVSNGHKEIVVTGIDTGSYGKDLGITFYDLLKELSLIDGLLRIRISSLELSQITDDIINLIKDNPKFVHHLHIPIQNGSNRILKLMNRHYDRFEFIEKINYIKSLIPDISITTDYISGFPTETDEDFNESLDTLNKVGFQMIHAFPYSLRKGTKAALLDQVNPEIKKERNKKVLALSKSNYKAFVESNIGNTFDVIFETYKDGYLYGHTGSYIYVKAIGSISNLNKLLKVKLIENEIDACKSIIIN
mgnify:CR=1 FL=1